MESWLSPVYNALNGGGFSMGETETQTAIRGLEESLRKSAEIGYQTAPGMDSQANLSPLLVQSIDDKLADQTTYGTKDFVFFNKLPQDQARQTLHEVRTRTLHGDRFLNLSAGEGDAGVPDDSQFGADYVQMKYWVTKRKLSYQAVNIPTQALVSGPILAEYTNDAVIQIRRQLEVDCLFGDAAINSLETDGVCTQLDTAGIGEDLGGAQLTFDKIERKLAELTNVDIGGHPTDLLVTPDIYADMIVQAQADHQTGSSLMRFADGAGSISGRNFTFGATGLEVFVPGSNEKIKISKIPFLDNQRAFGSPFKPGTTTVVLASSDAQAPAAPSISTDATAAPGGYFTAGEAGKYQYYIMAVNKYGHSTAVQTQAVTVAAGDAVTVLLNVPGSNLPVFYNVFRTKKVGNSATPDIATARFLFRAKYATAGSPLKVVITDDGSVKRDTGRALLLNLQDKGELAFYRLLPMARIPLPMVDLFAQFAVFMSGAVKVKVPRKQYQWKTVGLG